MKKLALILLAFSVTCHAGVIRQGVRHFSKSGDTALIGNVTISEGSNITLTQIGQNIAISSTATGGAGGNFDTFNLIGGVTLTDDVDGVRQVTSASTVSTVYCNMRNSGTSGTTYVGVYYGPTLNSGTTLTVTGNGSFNYNSISPAISLSAFDYVALQVTGVANGAPEDLTCKVTYQ